jgi:hypothetical protein
MFVGSVRQRYLAYVRQLVARFDAPERNLDSFRASRRVNQSRPEAGDALVTRKPNTRVQDSIRSFSEESISERL